MCSVLSAICPGGSNCKRSNNFSASGCSHTISSVSSTEANGPPLSRNFIQVSKYIFDTMVCVSCINEDNGGTHRTPHSQASNSPHRKLEPKGYTF